VPLDVLSRELFEHDHVSRFTFFDGGIATLGDSTLGFERKLTGVRHAQHG
jgi:hypothetical protein